MDPRLWDGIVKHLRNELNVDPIALFDVWKLGPGSGWENVAEHCLVQAGAHIVFDPIVGFTPYETNMLARTALCHDLKKRLEVGRKKGWSEFSDAALDNAENLLSAASPSWEMVEKILVPGFIPRFVENGATLVERVLFIIDDMARDGNIVSFDDRVDEASLRNPDPEPEIRQKLGRPYWDVEREVGHLILTGLMVILRRDNGLVETVKTMSDVPRLINAEMQKQFVN